MKLDLSDIAEQLRQMGREDWLAGDLTPPFGEKSLAHQYWREDVEQARQMPLLAVAEMEATNGDFA